MIMIGRRVRCPTDSVSNHFGTGSCSSPGYCLYPLATAAGTSDLPAFTRRRVCVN